MRFHIFHNWTKWTVVKQGDIGRRSTGAVVGYFYVQERKCTVCGFVQRKLKENY